MFISSRFKTIPTKKCRRRLEQALSNRKPISRRERNRSAVIAIQSALADLNRGYLLSAEVDGFYGSRTYDAVEAFQRDYGMVADGQVGRQTITQLDALYSGDVIRNPEGVSIHIGVDRVDPQHYGGDFALASCENDAKRMAAIADSLGYNTLTLINEEATVLNFTSFMRNSIENLFSGDSLLLSFSGHGSQVANTSLDSESDNRDETLCFYDRMFIDDEMYALLAQLREGVRVHLVFDSCHSGTVAKRVDILKSEKEEYLAKSLTSIKSLNGKIDDNDAVALDEMLKPISSKSIAQALDGDQPVFVKDPVVKTDQSKKIAKMFADLFDEENKGASKSIEFFNGIYDRNQVLYDTVKNVVGPKGAQHLKCSVVTLSACQDYQTTPAGTVLSLFTANINRSWGSAEFSGSYRDFHNSVVENTNRPDVTPALNVYGGNRSNAMMYERPFVI